MSSYTQHLIRIAALIAVFFIFTGVAYAAPVQTATRAELPQQDASLYAVDPQPLTVAQCGQCHPSHFGDLQQAGGKHQFDCRECHQVFHAYNPLKNNYATIMPQCATCHGQPHGSKHASCATCHGNPHAPGKVQLTTMLATICADCHSTQTAELQTFPSKHTEQECSSCHHTSHGNIPSCAECHEPHFEAQAQATCTQCHPVHQPRTIALNSDVDLQTCNACHENIYAKWKSTPSKHGQVGCAQCHTAHAMIPQCSNCHETPASHAKTMMEMFPNCLDCHLDVHDLPVKK